MNILDACNDPNLFAPWFRDRATWRAWFAFMAALFGLPMEEEQAESYRRHTGREALPTTPFEEGWLVVGRRGGKSFIMALIGVFLACFRDYRPYLQPGERATVAVIAADRKQARIILRYVRGLLTLVPMLKRMVVTESAESFDLNNSATIEVTTASFRSSRGYAFAAVLVDELAFLRTGDEVANPDYEILAAIRPGLASIPGAMLICASSPHARMGELWNAYRKWYGKEGAPLVWRATTRDMNPGIRQSVIDEALERDQARGAAEFLAEFRSDLEACFTREVVEACVPRGVHERGPICYRDGSLSTRYRAFVDPSGGSSDSFTMAIAHMDRGRIVLDVIRERKPPFSPEDVVHEFVTTLARYGIREVTGDAYAGEWPRTQFRKLGVEYRVSDKNRSEIYRDLLPALNSRSVELLDSEKMINQIVQLERRVSSGGRESINHPPSGHDDLANSCAGVITACSWERAAPEAFFGKFN